MIPEADQEAVTAFRTQSTEYASKSEEISRVLKEFGDTMAAFLSDATSTVQDAIKTYKVDAGRKARCTFEARPIDLDWQWKEFGGLGLAALPNTNTKELQQGKGLHAPFSAESFMHRLVHL